MPSSEFVQADKCTEKKTGFSDRRRWPADFPPFSPSPRGGRVAPFFTWHTDTHTHTHTPTHQGGQHSKAYQSGQASTQDAAFHLLQEVLEGIVEIFHICQKKRKHLGVKNGHLTILKSWPPCCTQQHTHCRCRHCTRVARLAFSRPEFLRIY